MDDGTPRRHLLYFVCPIQGNGVWQWNCEQLRPRLGLFDGVKVVAVSTPPARKRGARRATLDSIDDVKKALPGCECVPFVNDPELGESVAWPYLWSRVPRNGVTLYAHAKGVRYGYRPYDESEYGKMGVCVRRWTEAMYSTCLDWPRVEEQLKDHLLCGTFKKVGPGMFPDLPSSQWHYSGSFYWVRNEEWFARGGHKRIKNRMASEAVPGILYKPEEGGCLLHEGGDLNLYSPEVWGRLDALAVAS